MAETKDSACAILAWALAVDMAAEIPAGMRNGSMSCSEIERRIDDLERLERAMLALPGVDSPDELLRFGRAVRGSLEWMQAREDLLAWIAGGIVS